MMSFRVLALFSFTIVFFICSFGCSVEDTSDREPLKPQKESKVNAIPNTKLKTKLLNEKIELLTSQIQTNKTPDEVQVILKNIFGEPDHSGGGGCILEDWTFEDGRLVFHSGINLSFHPKVGAAIEITRTTSPLKDSLFGRYSMMTKLLKDKPDSRFLLGKLALKEEGTYLYEDSALFPDKREEYKQNFFILYPSGNFTLTYLSGFEPETLLERVEDKVKVAKLSFTSQDGSKTKEYFVATQKSLGHLVFVSEDKINFDMSKSFRYFWIYNKK